MEILFDKTPSPGVLAIKLWVNSGSGNDPLGQRGAHQLLSSLLTRGCGPHDKNSVASLIENSGASLRADAHEDGILVSLKCSPNDCEKLLPLLGWMIFNPHLESDQVELEKELSLQALSRQKENPYCLAFDGWRQIAYGNGPYGHDPLGYEPDLKSLNTKDLKPIANNLKREFKVLAIAGCKEKELEGFFKYNKQFSTFSKQMDASFSTIVDHKISTFSNDNNKNLFHKFESTGQVVIMLGRPTVPHNHRYDLHLRLLNCHAGLGMSSILFKRLREDHGVAYDVGIHHPTRQRQAPFVMHASTSEEKALLTLQLLLDTWYELSQKLMTTSETELAKAKFRGQLAHENQTASQRAERLAHLKSFNMNPSQDQISLDIVEDITSEELKDVASQILQKPLLSLCGPEKCIKKLTKYWNSLDK